MLKISKSNVFNVNADCIVNTVNCVGFMGKGLALECALRYPELLSIYKAKCKNNEIKVGKVDYIIRSDVKIINFPTKYDYKYPSKIGWIQSGLEDFVKTYKNYNLNSVAFPLLGCSNGGLNRDVVKNLMIKYLENVDINIIICTNEINPEGKELEMINNFNNISINQLSNQIKLNYKQKEILKDAQHHINRFNDISKLDGIGLKTFSNIFRYFYENNISNYNQMCLF